MPACWGGGGCGVCDFWQHAGLVVLRWWRRGQKAAPAGASPCRDLAAVAFVALALTLGQSAQAQASRGGAGGNPNAGDNCLGSSKQSFPISTPIKQHFSLRLQTQPAPKLA